jgi:hypothetical protein
MLACAYGCDVSFGDAGGLALITIFLLFSGSIFKVLVYKINLLAVFDFLFMQLVKAINFLSKFCQTQ